MNRISVMATILAVMLPLSGFTCPADGKHEPPKPFDPKTAGNLIDPKTLTPIEERLNAIVVPEIDFRCANIYDIIAFYDACVKEHGGDREKDDKSRVRLVSDEKGFGEDIPLIHFASLKMPLLYAIKLTCKIGGLEYRIKDNTVTVFRPEKTNRPTTKPTLSSEAAPGAASAER